MNQRELKIPTFRIREYIFGETFKWLKCTILFVTNIATTWRLNVNILFLYLQKNKELMNDLVANCKVKNGKNFLYSLI